MTAQEPVGATVVACLASVAAGLPAPAAAALERIDGSERRLLAARAYRRAGKGLDARWSWSEREIDDYRDSGEWRALQVQLQQVRSTFEGLNPGHTLYVNDQVRSLDRQIERWNDNASVAAAANALWRDAGAQLSAAGSACADRDVSARFAAWLQAWNPEPVPTLAAPGLSPHGQSRAFDFQVRQGDRIIAGTDSRRSAADWDDAGWTQRLAIAIAQSGARFRGPLASPREPWHYAYEP